MQKKLVSIQARKEFYDLKGNIKAIEEWHRVNTPEICKSEALVTRIMQTYEQEYLILQQQIKTRALLREKLKESDISEEELLLLPRLSKQGGCDCYFIKIKTMEDDKTLRAIDRCFCSSKNAGILEPL